MSDLHIKNLTNGLGSPKEDGTGACVMAWVNVQWKLEQGMSLSDALRDPTDAPFCTEPMIRHAAIAVNDSLDNVERQRLIDRIPRLMAASQVDDPETARRCRVRVACWAARSVLHLVDESDRDVCEAAISTAERWLDGEATVEECRDAAYAVAARAARAAAYAAARDAAFDAAAHATRGDAHAAARAADAHAAARDAAIETDLVDWLDDLLDQWEKARAEEGVLA